MRDGPVGRLLWRALEVAGRVVGVPAARWLASVVMRARGYERSRLRMVLREPQPAPRLWKVPAEWLSVRPRVRVRRLGLRLELDLRDNLQRTVYFTGAYEPALAAFLADDLHPGDVMADVGAHIGTHALAAARHGARVIAFEPAPDSAARLRAAAAENGLEVEVVEAALGREPATWVLRSDPRYDPADAGVRSFTAAGEEVAEVPVTTLDSYALERLDVLKVDVEGAESAVLDGARETLERCRPRAVALEVKGHGDEEALRTVLASCGYRSSGRVFDRNELFRPS